jgi:hypothetical protein
MSGEKIWSPHCHVTRKNYKRTREQKNILGEQQKQARVLTVFSREGFMEKQSEKDESCA